MDFTQFNISSIAVKNSWWKDGRSGGTLISPNSIILATHYISPVGTEYIWPNGESAKIIKLISIGNDLSVGILDKPLIDTKPLKIIRHNGIGLVCNQKREWFKVVIETGETTVHWNKRLVSGDSGSAILGIKKAETGLVAIAKLPSSGVALVNYIKKLNGIINENN